MYEKWLLICFSLHVMINAWGWMSFNIFIRLKYFSFGFATLTIWFLPFYMNLLFTIYATIFFHDFWILFLRKTSSSQDYKIDLWFFHLLAWINLSFINLSGHWSIWKIRILLMIWRRTLTLFHLLPKYHSQHYSWSWSWNTPWII